MNEGAPLSDIDYDLLMKIQAGALSYSYRSIPMQKDPFDLALYSLLFDRLMPRTIIEVGSFKGGSALWFADQATARGLNPNVISIDVSPPTVAPDVADERIRFLQCDARNLVNVLPPQFMKSIPRPLLVVEDSSHMAADTAAVLDFFDGWMQTGEYIVIEDGILSDMRVPHLYDGGPLHAIEAFLQRSGMRYEVDRSLCDHFGRNCTWNVNGYLRRI